MSALASTPDPRSDVAALPKCATCGQSDWERRLRQGEESKAPQLFSSSSSYFAFISATDRQLSIHSSLDVQPFKQQRLRRLYDRRVKALPIVDWHEQIAGGVASAPVEPELCEPRFGAQFTGS